MICHLLDKFTVTPKKKHLEKKHIAFFIHENFLNDHFIYKELIKYVYNFKVTYK